MSAETLSALNVNTLIGFTEKRGNAWHYRSELQGEESNHYAGAIPPEDVTRRLFNYRAEARPIYVMGEPIVTEDGVTPGEPIAIPNRIAVTRDDNGYVMGIFRESYAIHQFQEWFTGPIANMLDDTVSIGNAGILKGGAVGFLQVEVPENIVSPDGVEFRPFILAITSHDGTQATQYKRCATNVVCDNTMAMAQSEDGMGLKIRHSRYSGLKIGNARDALGIIHSDADTFMEDVNKLNATKVSARAFAKFVDVWQPMPGADANKRAVTMATNKRETLTNLWKSDPRVTPWKGTAWGVVQAVNTYDQHFTAVKRGELTEAQKGAARYERTVLGTASGELDKSNEAVRAMLASVLV